MAGEKRRAIDPNDLHTEFQVIHERGNGLPTYLIRGKIILDADDDNPDRRHCIGHLTALHIPDFESWEDVYDFADGDSQDGEMLADLSVRKWLYRRSTTSWLGVKSLVVSKLWRGRKAGYLAMRELIWLFGRKGTAVTCYPYPIGRCAKGAQDKLQRYWEAFGFRPVPGSSGVYGVHLDAGSQRLTHMRIKAGWPSETFMNPWVAQQKKGKRP